MVVGGAIQLGYFAKHTSTAGEYAVLAGPGGVSAVFGGLVILYEIIMTILTWKEKVNRSVRLLVVSLMRLNSH